MNEPTRIPQATLRDEWAVAVTELWARALGGAVRQAAAGGPAAVYASAGLRRTA